MQYFSIDIETTGLNPETDQILQIGIAFEDTEKLCVFEDIPTTETLIRHNRIEGDPFAINMNQGIIQKLSKLNGYGHITENYIAEDNIGSWMFQFVSEQLHRSCHDKIRINVAGKNFSSFDRLFLNKHIDATYHLSFGHRVIDPTMLCVDWHQETLPNLQQCLESCRETHNVKHTAVEDALDVIRIIRLKTKNYTI